MNPLLDLSGRGVVVTGGNGVIGLGMARGLLAAGASVCIWRSNAAKTLQARAQLAAECGDGARVHSAVCNVADEAQVEAAFEQSVAALGKVHACFANAGVSAKGTMLLEMSLDEFRRVQRVNVEGVFLTFRAAARSRPRGVSALWSARQTCGRPRKSRWLRSAPSSSPSRMTSSSRPKPPPVTRNR